MNYEELLVDAKAKQYDIGVCARVIYNGRILLLRRAKGDNYENIWEMPGGGVELGEDPKTSIVREIFEEASIKTKVEDLSFVDYFEFNNIEKNKHKRKFCFGLNLSDSNIKVSNEHSEYKFFAKGELIKLRDSEHYPENYEIWSDHYKLALQYYD